MTYSIYVLVDPRNGEAFYVGCTTKTPEERTRLHVLNTRRTMRLGNGLTLQRETVQRRIAGLLKGGVLPEVQVLTTVASPFEASRAEWLWILRLEDVGFRLSNRSSGGEGIR